MPSRKAGLAVGDGWVDDQDRDDALDRKPLTPEQARQWRARHPAPSVWRVVGWQVGLTLLVAAAAALVVWAGVGGTSLVASVAYGGLCVMLPSAAMAWGMTSSALARWLQRAAPGAARTLLAGWLWWEGVKVLLTLAMLWSAPRWIPDLNWLGLVVGLVVVLKSYWLAWVVRPTARGRA
jgi:ATP synthase protein I